MFTREELIEHINIFIKGIFVFIFWPFIGIWCAGYVFTQMVKDWKYRD